MATLDTDSGIDCIEALREDWPALSVDQIQRLIEFAHAHRPRSTP